jgi:ribosomal peptide maturation radical SAM protein 1
VRSAEPSQPDRLHHRPGRATVAERAALPVVLVAMPFLDLDRPSIQIGLLKAIAERAGFPARTVHANLHLGARIGATAYHALAQQHGRMVGDWLFSAEAFGDAAPDPDGRLLDDFAGDLSFLADVAGDGDVRTMLTTFRAEAIPAYLDRLVDDPLWQGVRVVGFSCTFQQNTASFALARRLKQRRPEVVTVFGGANFDGAMGVEYLRHLAYVDVIVSGEADTAFPGLLDALAAGTDPGAVPGVAHRMDGSLVVTPPAEPTTVLDDLPIPDYDEYFDLAESLGLLAPRAHRTVGIPFESARGCWWGQKHHCVFCGLNGATMRFRAKSADRVFTELVHQARRYRSFRFEAVDNILDMGYLKQLLPRLAGEATGFDVFYEVKANLTGDQLKLLADAGVRTLQPGLESLSSHVLRLMRKGVRAAQNVNLLRWAQVYGITVEWNVLWGFPGEREADYVEQAGAVPHLVHLQPPAGAAKIWMERFSPLFADPTVPVLSRAPDRSYAYVYPTCFDLGEIAYFFEYELSDALPDSAYEDLGRAVRAWRQAWEADRPPVLRYWSAPGFLQIYDGRRPGREGTYTFEGVPADIYRAVCDRPRTAAAIRREVNPALAAEAIREVLDEFGRRGLVFLDGDLTVALATPAGVAGR